MKQHQRLAGKVAIIVGAGQEPGETIGNGRAVAERFAEEGATLLLVDINKEHAEATLAAIAPYESTASILIADITNEADCQKIASTCVERYGRIDILHNNVGRSQGDRKTVDLDVSAWDAIMGLNLRGMFMTCKHVLPVMIRQKRAVLSIFLQHPRWQRALP